MEPVLALALGAALTGGCGRVGYDTWSGSGSNDATIGVTPEAGGAGGAPDGAGGSAASDAAGAGSGGAEVDAASAGGAPGTGGSAAAGGGTGSGGAPATGGTAGAGAASGTGGALGTGGVLGTGGTLASGGAPGTGGAGDAGPCVVTNGGVETCDGLDNDCGGAVDEGAICGAQCIGATYDGHAYAFCSSPLDFATAATECQSKGMRLVRVDDDPENQFVASLAFPPGSGNETTTWPWLGAYDRTAPIQWTFMDGTVFWTGRNSGSPVGGLYSHWASASPGDGSGTYCATMNRGADWIDRGCSNVQPYLCEVY